MGLSKSFMQTHAAAIVRKNAIPNMGSAALISIPIGWPEGDLGAQNKIQRYNTEKTRNNPVPIRTPFKSHIVSSFPKEILGEPKEGLGS